MNVEHFLITNKGNPEFKKRIQRAQKNCLERDGAVTKPELIAGHIILHARDNLQRIQKGNISGTPDELEAEKVKNYAAIFMGELIREGEKIGSNQFSVGKFVGRVNQMVSGTELPGLPPPPKHRELTQDEWKKFVTISREDQTGATFLKDINNLPLTLKRYIVNNPQVANLYRYINTYGLIDDYEDLARSVIYDDVKLGDAAPSSSRSFNRDMRKSLRKFWRSYTPTDDKRIEEPKDAPSQKAPRPDDEFQTDYQERRDGADLAEEFLREKRTPPEPLPDDAAALVHGIIGGLPVLSELQQRRLDEEALRKTVSADTFDRHIGVVNLEIGDNAEHRERKLKTTPSYFGVVHEDHLEEDLAVVDADKKKLIADVAITLIQTGKRNKWGESARKIAKKGRKELARKHALEREKLGTIELEDPAEAAVTVHRLTQAIGVSRELTEGEEFNVEKRIITRLRSSGVREGTIPGLEERVHLGFVDGEELWYIEPKGNPKNPDLRKTIEKKTIDAHDAKVRQSKEGLPAEGNRKEFDLFMDELFSRGRVDAFKEEKSEQTAARYLARIKELMKLRTVWSVPTTAESQDPLGDMVNAIEVRDATVAKLIKFAASLGKETEAEQARAEGQKVELGEEEGHDVRYRSIIDRVNLYKKLTQSGVVNYQPDQMEQVLQAMAERAEQLLKNSKEDTA